MRLGVVSDSHGHVDNVRPAIRMLESLEVDRVLHCGDVGSMAVVEMFAAWPTDFVFGNCDYQRAEFAASIARVGQTCHGEFGDLEIDGKRIALIHSDDRRRFQQTIQSGDFDLVCYGHTHVAAIERLGDALVLNPGALYRADPYSIAIVELPSLEATIVRL
jgi:putative phosphoesterase